MATYIPIERIASQLREAPFYIEMDFYLIVENAYKALRELRMIPLQRIFATATIKDYKIQLPIYHTIFNVVRLTGQYEPTLNGIYHPNQVVFTVPDEDSTNLKRSLSALDEIKKVIPHIIGEYIDYEVDAKCLRFKETDIDVGVEYNTLAVDEHGYPLIPDQCEEAVIYYIAWINFVGEFMANRLDANKMQYFEMLKERKLKEAKLDHRFSQNDIDKMLNVMTSFDRKSYGWSA